MRALDLAPSRAESGGGDGGGDGGGGDGGGDGGGGEGGGGDGGGGNPFGGGGLSSSSVTFFGPMAMRLRMCTRSDSIDAFASSHLIISMTRFETATGILSMSMHRAPVLSWMAATLLSGISVTMSYMKFLPPSLIDV